MQQDLSIEPDEIDPTNISSYGIGNRPSRSRKPIDYSSEEAFQKAGLAPGEAAGEEDDDKEFKAVSTACVGGKEPGLGEPVFSWLASMGRPFADCAQRVSGRATRTCIHPWRTSLLNVTSISHPISIESHIQGKEDDY